MENKDSDMLHEFIMKKTMLIHVMVESWHLDGGVNLVSNVTSSWG